MVTSTHLDKSLTYPEYLLLLNNLLAQGKTTGPDQSDDFVEYAKLNMQRMNRLNKTVILLPELKAALKSIKGKYVWLTLTEGWCGDAAQNIPIFHAMENECPNIELRLLLRDENLDLMDQYLTNGTRSIPKLICLERESLKEIFTWGPRPQAVQNIMMELKAKNTPKQESIIAVQKWYNADATKTAQQEFLQLLKLLK